MDKFTQRLLDEVRSEIANKPAEDALELLHYLIGSLDLMIGDICDSEGGIKSAVGRDINRIPDADIARFGGLA